MKGSRIHVLVVDIDLDFLITIERLLEDQGLDTTVTWDIKEALELLASKQFEFVLVGHHPPELNASEILPHLGRARPYLIVQPTSRMSPDSRIFLSQGAKGVLCKWHYDEITEQVKKCVTQAQDEDTDCGGSGCEPRSRAA